MSMVILVEKERDKKFKDNIKFKLLVLLVFVVFDGLYNDKEKSKKCSF